MYSMMSQEMMASAVELVCLVSTALAAIFGYFMALRF
jgi:hypothetical protein